MIINYAFVIPAASTSKSCDLDEVPSIAVTPLLTGTLPIHFIIYVSQIQLFKTSQHFALFVWYLNNENK